ncbi:hypothetical protein K443DRAFT_28028, partial [Laccaria amethystina LaAM-08-1]
EVNPWVDKAGSRIEKKTQGQKNFPSTLGGLTNYVIRHMSWYGNTASSSAAMHTLCKPSVEAPVQVMCIAGGTEYK